MSANGTAVWTIGVVMLAAAGGCDDDRPPPPRPMEGRGTSTQASGQPPSDPEPDSLDPSLAGGGAGDGTRRGDQTGRGGAGRAGTGDDPRSPLEDALRNALAGAQGCLPTDDPSLTGEVTARATVNVSATGRVTRASASGNGLPKVAADCIEGRLESHRFPAPGADASRSASTSVTWRFRRDEPAEPQPDDPASTHDPSSGYGIQGPSGVRIQPSKAQQPTGPSGVPIQPSQGEPPTGPSGRAIDGPSGTPIGE